MTEALQEYQRDSIWLKEYPIHYAGCDFTARMTIVRLANGNLLIHSPCEIDDAVKEEIETLGTVEFIVAPGSYHYFYVSSAQSAFPTAETFICPGIERNRPELEFDWMATLWTTALSEIAGVATRKIIQHSRSAIEMRLVFIRLFSKNEYDSGRNYL